MNPLDKDRLTQTAEELTRLKEMQTTLQVVINAIDEGIHVVDEQGKTLIYNQTMGRLEGLDPSMVLNRNLLDVFPFLTAENSTLMKVLKDRKPILDIQQSYLNHKGERITTINSTFPLEHDGKFIGAMEIAKDVTRVRHLSEKIIDLQERLKYPKELKKRGLVPRFTFKNILGESPKFKETVEKAKRAAKADSAVLIYGETGTGKELFAQGMHDLSPRREGPFVAQNCAAMPESLLEGILFGTVKGGFTGAVDRPGLFEQADGGTLLLDEINSMGPSLQSKLLRVLQEKKVRRLGGLKEISVDVRVIATANVEPWKAVREGILRQDLYYRLGVVQIQIPPLREHKDDIPLLAEYFIRWYGEKMNKRGITLSPEAIALFFRHDWPGNVRELENAIEGAMALLDENGVITPHELPPYLTGTMPEPLATLDVQGKTLNELIEEVGRSAIRRSLQKNGGNITRAAAELGISRQLLQYKIKKYGLAEFCSL